MNVRPNTNCSVAHCSPHSGAYHTLVNAHLTLANAHLALANAGFYDENLEFLGLERVQIVASMNPSTTVGRWALSTRFTANVRIAVMGYPSTEELRHVISAKASASSVSFADSLDPDNLARCMVDVRFAR